MTPLASQALDLARAGFPVFPCAKTKRPAISKAEGGHGFHDASTDPEAVTKLFATPGAVLIGVPTGEASGVDALDIDPKNGGDAWEQANVHRLPETRVHQTPSGGRHYIFRHAPGVHNSTSSIAPGIDVRGSGGYICVPPAGAYTVISDAEPAEWPDWLLEQILPKTRAPQAPPAPRAPVSSLRVEGLIKSVLRRVSSAGEGQKHFTLRNAALSLGGYQHLGGYSTTEAVDWLLSALPPIEDRGNAHRTALWGLENGAKQPLELEDRPQYQARAQVANGHDYGEAPPDHMLGETEDVAPTRIHNGFPLVYIDDITPSLTAKDFVQGVIEEGAAAVVYGESNSGKTFWTTDFALHIAAGIPWRGRRIDQGAVIYAALEGNRGFRNRVAAWKEAHDTLENPILFAAIQSSINLLDASAAVPALIASIQAAADKFVSPVKLVVVDTLSRALAGGDENSSVDMGTLIANMDRIRAETGAAVLFVHHSGKDQAKGARGWSGIKAAIDTEIEVRVDEAGTRVAETVKQREMKKGDIFAFTLDVIELGMNQHGEPVTTCLVKHSNDEAHAGASLHRRRLPQQQQRALEVLADLVAGSGQSGHTGTPAGTLSVPEKWWRERFYDRALPGAEDDAKRKAFRRAADALISGKYVAMSAGRVWVISYEKEGT